ncbi:MAG: hypothetical protein U9N14_01275 [Pseudomonadota bacterium]|nr:hypothetical protein [Pseudomonadota bacterium]
MRIVALFATLVMLTACAGQVEKTEYWQRDSFSSAMHLRGERAQTALERDIAECRCEMMFAWADAQAVNPPIVPPCGLNEDALEDWEDAVEDRQGFDPEDILPVQMSLDDDVFEDCMSKRGWSRTEFCSNCPRTGVSGRMVGERAGNNKKKNDDFAAMRNR